MDDNQRADLLCEVAERHRITTWEAYQMVRLVVFGPDAVDNQVFDPVEELEYRAHRDRERLKERPSIQELIAIWQRSHDVCLAIAERQSNPTKRAAWFAQLAEREAEMAALRERLAQVLRDALDAEPEDEIFAEGELRMRAFRAFRANAKRA
jgi:hypothetical protein